MDESSPELSADVLVPALVELLDQWDIEDIEPLAEAIAGTVIDLFTIRDESVHDAVVRSVALARADGSLAERDEALIVAAAMTARKIDVQDKYFAELERDAVSRGLRPPSQDNVSLPTLLKYLVALRLTPEARKPAATKGAVAGAGVVDFRERARKRRSG